jgi:acetyltransferase-like isoleucine patch superfamily enzyme
MIRRLIRALLREVDIRRDPVSYAQRIGVKIGKDCRLISLSSGTFGSEPYLVTLGDHVTISGGVRFVTHDGGVWVFRSEVPDIDVIGPIVIGSNVFVGLNCILMPGVSIGDNCVIGAGSVVTRSIPDGSIAVGVPARVIGSFESYREKSLERGIYIRGMQPAEKRRYLEKMFSQESK